MLFIFLDTETTGLNPEKHRILEIAFKVYDSVTEQPILSYESVVSQTPEMWAIADPESLFINGFTWEEILKGKSEKVVTSEIINDFNRLNIREKTGVFVCQNPAFDKAFFLQLINDDLQRQMGWPYHWLDLASMYWAIRYSKDPHSAKYLKEKDFSKNEIAIHYGIEPEFIPHRAMRGVNHLLACYKTVLSSTIPV